MRPSNTCDPRVLLIGTTRWIRILEDELIECSIPARFITNQQICSDLKKFNLSRMAFIFRSNIIHWTMVTENRQWFIRWAERHNKKTVAHWIGSDILELRKSIKTNNDFLRSVQTTPAIHLADSPALQAELREFDIESTVIRLLPKSIEAKEIPLPKTPGILTYWANGFEEFYRMDIVATLAQRYPNVRFMVAGATCPANYSCPSNMDFLGPVDDMNTVYQQTTAFLRIVKHDSLSAMVLEALARGRHVIYSEEFPHTHTAKTAEEAALALDAILRLNIPNQEGAEYVHKHFSWRNEINKLKSIYSQILQKPHI